MNHRLAGFSLLLAACAGSEPPPPSPTAPSSAQTPPPAMQAAPGGSWAVPDGFRSETIPFPLEFAPTLDHRGVEELRFAPGFFEPTAPGYWSYTFVWRVEDAALLDAAGLSRELDLYFRGLLTAVDAAAVQALRDPIAVTAAPAGQGFAITARVVDAFKTKRPLTLTGRAERRACPGGALWIFALSPESSGVRDQLTALASEAACGQAPVPNKPR